MTFKIVKPSLIPPRGPSLVKPVEQLHSAVGLLSRSLGDAKQSAVRVGELLDSGFFVLNSDGVLVPNFETPAQAANGLDNFIINGDFNRWSRGAFLGAGTGFRYLADRWWTFSAGSTIAPSQQVFATGQTEVPGGPTLYHRAQVVSVAGANNVALMGQRIENTRKFSDVTCSLSFWARADAPKPMSVEFAQHFGTGGSPVVDMLGVVKLNLTTSWKKYSVKVKFPSIAGKTISTLTSFIEAIFWFDSGSASNGHNDSLGQRSGTFDIAMVQLEYGDVTEMQRRPEALEALLCQRYFERWYADTAFGLQVSGYASAAAQNIAFLVSYLAEKRAVPALSLGGPAFTLGNCTFGGFRPGRNETTFFLVSSAAGQVQFFAPDPTSYIDIDAEL